MSSAYRDEREGRIAALEARVGALSAENEKLKERLGGGTRLCSPSSFTACPGCHVSSLGPAYDQRSPIRRQYQGYSRLRAWISRSPREAHMLVSCESCGARWHERVPDPPSAST